jgi:hypothetical protein
MDHRVWTGMLTTSERAPILGVAAQTDDVLRSSLSANDQHPQPAMRAAVMPANTAAPNHLLELNLARQSALESRSTVETCHVSTPHTGAAVESATGQCACWHDNAETSNCYEYMAISIQRFGMTCELLQSKWTKHRRSTAHQSALQRDSADFWMRYKKCRRTCHASCEPAAPRPR